MTRWLERLRLLLRSCLRTGKRFLRPHTLFGTPLFGEELLSSLMRPSFGGGAGCLLATEAATASPNATSSAGANGSKSAAAVRVAGSSLCSLCSLWLATASAISACWIARSAVASWTFLSSSCTRRWCIPSAKACSSLAACKLCCLALTSNNFAIASARPLACRRVYLFCHDIF